MQIRTQIPALTLLFLGFPVVHDQQSFRDQTGSLQLSNPSVTVTVHPYGGALVGLNHTGSDVNPFSWSLSPEQMPENNRKGAPFRGHFICLNRWGAPTPGEQAIGIPHNGEASNLPWKILDIHNGHLSMEVRAPLDQILVERKVTIDPRHPVILFQERYTNLAPFARPFMLVQHGTFAPPFLDRETLTDSNAGEGFLQSDSRPDPGTKNYSWPMKEEMNVRHSDQPEGFVATHLVPDSTGWCTLSSPGSGFLVGYLWNAADYPWLHIWHGAVDGQPVARGIEFGNTGLGDNYPLMDRYRQNTFGHPHATLMEGKTTLHCSFCLFTADLPEGFRGVTDVVLRHGALILTMATENGTEEVIYRSLQLQMTCNERTDDEM